MKSNVQQPRKKRTTRLRRLAMWLVGSGAVFALIAHWFAGPIVLHKLEATVAAHLDASLTVGSITYRPPFTVHLYDIHFVAHPRQPGGGTELLAARQMDLSLAKLPFGYGPLVIERFAIDGLTLHVIRAPDGKYVGLDLAKSSGEPASPSAMKLSDVLRLRHFSLKDGTVIYQDQADSRASPTQWQGISSEIALAPRSTSLYGFKFDAFDAPIAKAGVEGTLDVDSLRLQVERCSASIEAKGDQSGLGPDPLPAALRQWVRRYSVKGAITLSATGALPLTDPQQGSFSADLGVNGGGATLPEGGQKLDDLALATHVEFQTSDTAGHQMKARLDQFRAVSGGAILNLGSAIALIDSTGKWSVSGASGSLDAPPTNHGPWGATGHADFHADIAHDPQSNQTPFVGVVNLVGIDLQPDRSAAPLTGLTGTIHFAGKDATDRQIDFENFSAEYGGDHLALAHAQVGLSLFPDRILVSDIRSHLDLVQDAPQCPGDLGPILKTFQPSGPFDIIGTAVLQHVIRDDGPGYSPEWDLSVSTENGALALLDERLPVTAIKGRILATKHAISIPALQGTLLGGGVNLVGTARVVEPIVYQGEVNVHDASVEQFSQVFKLKSPDGTEPSGLGNLRFKFFSNAVTTSTGEAATQATSESSDEAEEWLSMLGGDGSLQIDNGNLWALPALQSLTHHTRVAREALTAGEAAAIFSIANRTIYFKHVAVYSPALGLQGSGSETFTGMLNLDIIAAPLGDWKAKLAETNVPIFSHFLSIAAGSIENLVSSATSNLLYHFRITGTRDDPQIETIPAPFITDSAASLFAKMLHHDDNSKLIDAVNAK